MRKLTGHILVVDDNRMNRIKISRSVQRFGHTVVMAANGQKALEALRNESFDLVLLDIFMPVMDGFEFLVQKKRDPTWDPIPVVVISALEELDNVMTCIEFGVADYLAKRFDPRLLKARINACLEKKRLHDEHVECLHLVGHLAQAINAIENKTFSPEFLTDMAARPDEWGQLATLLQKVAPQIYHPKFSQHATMSQPDYKALRREPTSTSVRNTVLKRRSNVEV